jgi:low affinity Fe/Cu permease
VTERRGPFDRFADWTERHVASAWFFAACVVLILVWAPTVAWLPLDTWQLIVNTLTTIITFLLVALLTNTQRRSGERIEEKLDRLLEERQR